MTDRAVVRIVVGGLALSLLACIIGAVTLAVTSQPVPDLIENIAIGSLTGLAGILARTGSEPMPVQPVTVVNAEADPVPVAETPEPPARRKAKPTT